VGTLRLTLLRHGHAQPQDQATEDFLRQLTIRGRAEATTMGRRLAQIHLVPDLILASSAQRTQTTAQLLAAAASVPADRIRYLDELYNAGAQRIWDLATAHADSGHHVLVCAHNPGISRLATRLAAGTPELPRPLELPPAGILTVLWPHGSWATLEQADASAGQFLVPQ
jgi:phosphohistidine phosphatase